MDKKFLLSSVDKFYLNGLVEKTIWEVKNNVLGVNFMSNNRDMTGTVFANGFDTLDKEKIAVFNLSQLYKLIEITGQEVNICLEKQHKVSTKILFSDDQYEVEYALSDALLIPKTPEVEEPAEFEFEFDITKELIDKYIKAKKALSSAELITVDITYDKDSKGIISFTLGESNSYSNKISFSSSATKLTIPSNSLIFNAEYIKEIFNSNKDLVTGKGFLTNDGLMKLKFNTADIASTYYLIAKE